MKAKVVTMNKTLASELLAKNIKNRKFKQTTLKSYVDQMNSGRWKNNGEPIIIDVNGFIKDGQHRLMAVTKTDFKYIVPIIYDVETDVMDTIDTGTNRSASDVLYLNGFKYSALISSISKKILAYRRNLTLEASGYSTKVYFSNSVILDFATKEQENIYSIIRSCESIYAKNTSTFSLSDFVFYAYALGFESPKEEHYEFLKHLAGIKIDESDAPSYVRNLTLNHKKNKTKINKDYLFALIIKSFNSFCLGNPPVRYVKWNSNNEFPKAIELN
jgi:hypothetical protein